MDIALFNFRFLIKQNFLHIFLYSWRFIDDVSTYSSSILIVCSRRKYYLLLACTSKIVMLVAAMQVVERILYHYEGMESL